MKTNSLIPIMLLSFSLSFSSAIFSVEPSSEIPAKRLFPIASEINPCDDFYEYNCKNVRASFKLRADRQRHAFAFSDSNERILDVKIKFLKELPTLKFKNKDDQKVASAMLPFYQSCLNKETRIEEEKKYVEQVKKDLEEIKTKEQWLSYELEKGPKGKASFIRLDNLSNFDRIDENDAVFVTDFSFLPEKSYLENEKLMEEFKKLTTDFFKTIGMDEKNAKYVVQYEKDYQKIRQFPNELRLAYSHRKFLDRSKLDKEFKYLSLSPFLNRHTPPSTLLRDLSPHLLPFLNEYLDSHDLTELKALTLFYTISRHLDFAYPLYYEHKFNLRRDYFGGKNKRSELEEECTQLTQSSFGPELDYLVIPKMFPKFNRNRVIRLAEKIKASIVKSLEQNRWLSIEGKAGARDKIQSAFLRLVSPEKFEDWHLMINSVYENNKFISNMENRLAEKIKREEEFFYKPRDVHSWEGVMPLTVNAFYEPNVNQFTLLQGILQYPFYDEANSDEENLAGIGMVIGHELGHGIDDQGAKYDSNGVLKEWMTEKDNAEFKKITQPLIKQYNDAGMNGDYTLGENIGDLVGLNSAYEAAFDGKSGNLDAKKSFFISYARSWCEVELPGMTELRIKSDPHSLGRARANEVVKNIPGFKEAFKCQATNKLFVEDQKIIRIW